MKEIIKFFFEQIKTNTALVAILTSILTLIFTQVFYLFSIKINAQMEIRKLMIKKSIDAHEELIKFLNENSKSVVSELNPINRFPSCMESIQDFYNFHTGLISIKIDYSHLYSKDLMNKLYELIDYSNTIIYCFNSKEGLNDSMIQQWGTELRAEIFGKFTDVQRVAELFLQHKIWSLKINPTTIAPRPFLVNETPGIKGTKLQAKLNELFEKESIES